MRTPQALTVTMSLGLLEWRWIGILVAHPLGCTVDFVCLGVTTHDPETQWLSREIEAPLGSGS